MPGTASISWISVSAAAGTTWNPSDKAASITLSNGNLTADTTVGTVYRWARSSTSKTAGKHYFEVTLNARASSSLDCAAIGTATSGSNLNNFIGGTSNDTGYYGDGSVYRNNGVVASLSSYAVSATVGCAIDVDAGLVWFRNGSGSFASGDPAAGTGNHSTCPVGGPIFAGFTMFTIGDQITANFGGSSFAYSVPSGFSAWG